MASSWQKKPPTRLGQTAGCAIYIKRRLIRQRSCNLSGSFLCCGFALRTFLPCIGFKFFLVGIVPNLELLEVVQRPNLRRSLAVVNFFQQVDDFATNFFHDFWNVRITVRELLGN